MSSCQEGHHPVVKLVGSRSNALFHTVVAALSLFVGCSRQALRSAQDSDASGPRPVMLRVPAALSIARAIDELSVTIDPASLGLTQVMTDAGTVIGVEREVFVFPEGQARPGQGRRELMPGTDFTASTDTWHTTRDRIPVTGTRYVVEMQLVLFETDVPAAKGWNPHAGEYKALWSRTLRQAEE